MAVSLSNDFFFPLRLTPDRDREPVRQPVQRPITARAPPPGDFVPDFEEGGVRYSGPSRKASAGARERPFRCVHVFMFVLSFSLLRKFSQDYHLPVYFLFVSCLSFFFSLFLCFFRVFFVFFSFLSMSGNMVASWPHSVLAFLGFVFLCGVCLRSLIV